MNIPDLTNLFNPDTDNHLVMSMLSDGNWHNGIEFQKAKDRPETGFICRNFAHRSRVSNIKNKIQGFGFTIESKIDTNGCATYRVIKAGQLDLLAI